jgi:histone deacetylase complex regulatory component SIN3
VQPPSSKTDASPHITNHNALTSNNQTGQNDQPPPPQEQNPSDAKDALETYDWEQLEERFHAEMEVCEKREDGIQEEFHELLDVSAISRH